MRYNIPQFIETEDKIIGPLTLKQFLYFVVEAMLLFFVYMFTDLTLFLIVAVPLTALFAAFAFYRVNNKPFILFLFSILKHYTKPRLFIWRRAPKIEVMAKKSIKEKEEAVKRAEELKRLKEHQSRLEQLSRFLDTTSGVPKAPLEPEKDIVALLEEVKAKNNNASSK